MFIQELQGLLCKKNPQSCVITTHKNAKISAHASPFLGMINSAMKDASFIWVKYTGGSTQRRGESYQTPSMGCPPTYPSWLNVKGQITLSKKIRVVACENHPPF
jgi:hypothetical protein